MFDLSAAVQGFALGLGLLLWHGSQAAVRALRGSAPPSDEPGVGPRGHWVALLTVCFLNPVAWLDTVLLLGTVGAAQPAHQQASFATGAIAASATWFTGLVAGASTASRWMASPRAWRWLDALVALAMAALALQVAAELMRR